MSCRTYSDAKQSIQREPLLAALSRDDSMAQPVLFASQPLEVWPPMTPPTPHVRGNAAPFASCSFWTASRGAQVISCELIAHGHGQPVLRCGYGPHAVIRSQVIASEDVATAVAELWKAALMEQGFRIQASRSTS